MENITEQRVAERISLKDNFFALMQAECLVPHNLRFAWYWQYYSVRFVWCTSSESLVISHHQLWVISCELYPWFSQKNLPVPRCWVNWNNFLLVWHNQQDFRILIDSQMWTNMVLGFLGIIYRYIDLSAVRVEMKWYIQGGKQFLQACNVNEEHDRAENLDLRDPSDHRFRIRWWLSSWN